MLVSLLHNTGKGYFTFGQSRVRVRRHGTCGHRRSAFFIRQGALPSAINKRAVSKNGVTSFVHAAAILTDGAQILDDARLGLGRQLHQVEVLHHLINDLSVFVFTVLLLNKGYRLLMINLFFCLLGDFQTAYLNSCFCGIGLLFIFVLFVSLGDGVTAVLGSVGVGVVFAKEPGVVA